PLECQDVRAQYLRILFRLLQGLRAGVQTRKVHFWKGLVKLNEPSNAFLFQYVTPGQQDYRCVNVPLFKGTLNRRNGSSQRDAYDLVWVQSSLFCSPKCVPMGSRTFGCERNLTTSLDVFE